MSVILLFCRKLRCVCWLLSRKVLLLCGADVLVFLVFLANASPLVSHTLTPILAHGPERSHLQRIGRMVPFEPFAAAIVRFLFLVYLQLGDVVA